MTYTRLTTTTLNPAKPISVKCSSTTTHIQDRSPGQSQSQHQVFNFAVGLAVHHEHVHRKAQLKLYNWHNATFLNLEAPLPSSLQSEDRVFNFAVPICSSPSSLSISTNLITKSITW
ncbi:hypothetical protein COP2_044867 [Malus domestica]